VIGCGASFTTWATTKAQGLVYEHAYMTPSQLRTSDNSQPEEQAIVLTLIESYDPEREAVVAIQYAPDEHFTEPEVVILDEAEWVRLQEARMHQ
jgi:hypothetical protein